MVQSIFLRSFSKNVARLSMISILLMLSGCVITEKFETFSADSEFNSMVVKADEAMRDGEWSKAAALYERAAQAKPDQLDWRVKQARAYRSGGNLALAFNMYQLIVDSKAPSSKANDEARAFAKAQLAKSGYKLEPLSSLIESKPVTLQVEAEPALKANEVRLPALNDKVVAVDAEASPAPSVDAKNVETLDASKAVYDEFNDWRGAWERKNIKAYFSHYVEGFSGDSKDADAWRKQRKTNILVAKNIQVTFSDAQLNFLADDTAELKFRQHYRSGSYKDVGNKTLKFKKVAKRWLIAQETFK